MYEREEVISSAVRRILLDTGAEKGYSTWIEKEEVLDGVLESKEGARAKR